MYTVEYGGRKEDNGTVLKEEKFGQNKRKTFSMARVVVRYLNIVQPSSEVFKNLF